MARQIMVVAGEASGDQHAADLVAELKRRDPSATFFGMGGGKLAAQGVELLFGAHEISVMGIVEVLPKLRRILQVMKALATAARERRPDVAILVDIPDFNLRLAKALRAQGIRVVYYISPTVWAWRQGRVKQIARRVDRMLCILPFEEKFYADRKVAARYVGNPVVEQVPAPAPASEFRRRLGIPHPGLLLALLPGSRMGEIRRILPTMAEAARALVRNHPGLRIVVPVAPTIAREEISSRLTGLEDRLTLVDGRAPEAVGASDVAVVASGTATLEAGLMERPLVVVYRMAPVSYGIGRMMVKLKHVSLVNLLLEETAVPELLQGEMTAPRIVAEVERLLAPGPEREKTVASLRRLRSVLGPAGASARAADAVQELLQGT